METPEFTKFTLPIIRKPAKKLIAEDLVGSPEDTIDLFRGVFKHMAEVAETLENCECPKCKGTA